MESSTFPPTPSSPSTPTEPDGPWPLPEFLPVPWLPEFLPVPWPLPGFDWVQVEVGLWLGDTLYVLRFWACPTAATAA
jgi:hypothetical protein